MIDRHQVREIRISKEFEISHEKYPLGEEIEIIASDRQACKMTVRFNIKTIIAYTSDGPVYRDSSVVDISLPKDYPMQLPCSVMRDAPPCHPNWYSNGLWSSGRWSMHEPLWDYIYRMGETIRFNPIHTNPDSPSNREAAIQWMKEENKKYFPTTPLHSNTNEP